MSDPAAAAAAAAVAAAAASAPQNQGVAGRPKLPIIEKARMKQMLDEPEVQQELARLVGGNASALQVIIDILKAMASSTDINSDPQMVELLKTHQVLRNKIGEAMERLKEIYILRELRNAEASSSNGAPGVLSAPMVPVPTPAPEQVRGKGDTLGGTESQHYQSIHEGAFKDYNPAPWPGVGSGPRPTLSGGLFSGYIDGTPASLARPPQDTSIFIPDVRHSSLRKAPGQDAVRKRIQELATTIDPGVKIDSEAETLLLEIADEFIESVTNFACRLAKHRGSESLEIKDLQLHLEMNHNIRIPGFSNELPVQQGNAAIATAAASTNAGAGASGAGGAPAGGGKKTDASTAGASGGGGGGGPKRSARLAAVQQAKRENRLL